MLVIVSSPFDAASSPSSSAASVPGYAYSTASGSGLPYGGYFQTGVDSACGTQIAWGEASSYAGPGNIWTAQERRA